MTQMSMAEKKRKLNLNPEGCPGCRHLRSYPNGTPMCTLYMDYPTEDDLKIGCIYRLGITSKSSFKRHKVQNND